MVKIALIDNEERMLNLVQKYVEQGIKENVQDNLKDNLKNNLKDNLENTIENNPSNTTEDNIEENHEVKISVFTKADVFLNTLEAGETFDIVCCDIELDDDNKNNNDNKNENDNDNKNENENGITLGKVIVEKYPHIYLIFVTSHPEFAAESYKIEAYQYILKQEMERRLPSLINKLIQKIEKERLQIRFIGTDSEKEKIFCQDIIYIHKVKGTKYVEYVTRNRTYRERIALDKLMSELQSDAFILVERAYIININRIDRISGNIICLENQKNIIISRARAREIKDKITHHWRNKLWK